uniref:Transmembrane protein 168 n=1 Tax=Ciona savignyi TaxID=51511 RepID=H2ZB13_CIOSA
MSPERVLDIWRESCADDERVTSRLLLLLDVIKSEPWIKAIKNLRDDYVAIQTCKLSYKDVETAAAYSPGAFTSEWVQWNCDVTNRTSCVTWFDDAESSVQPTYAVSRRWTDFASRLP